MIHVHAVVEKNIKNAAEESRGDKIAVKQKIKELSREKLVGIGDKLMFAVRFAKDCIDDRRYTDYGESAQLLAIVGEIKESMGSSGAKAPIFAEYKRKFPRHSSFQKEMKTYF